MTEEKTPAAHMVAEVRALVEDYLHTEVIQLTEPGTGVKALVEFSKDGTAILNPADFDAWRSAPVRRQGVARFTEITSLIDHVNRFKDDDSALFAIDDRKVPSIQAVLDYHRQTADGAPRFGHHRSSFAFPLSDEWQAWAAQDGKAMGMVEFAAFLEDRIIDVLELIPGEDALPEEMERFVNLSGGTIASPSKLMELSVGLKVNERAAVKEAINLSSGEAQVQFVSEHVDDAGHPLRVPGLFLIGIPVFQHGPLYRLAARLRYRKSALQGLTFFYELWRADRTFDHAFGEACERVKVETGLPLFFGQPE